MEKTISKITVVDWSRQKRATLNGTIGTDTSIGEVLGMAVHPLELSPEVTYSVFVTSPDGERQQKLNKTDTIGELGLEDGAELMLAPEVSAG